MPELALVVNGRRFGGWKSVRVTRSIESLAGSFEVEASDRWGGRDPWPIAEEDACRVELGGTVVLDGFVDGRDGELSADNRGISFSGYDRAVVLAECSALLDRWTFRDISVLDFAREVARPFDVVVSLADGVQLPKAPEKIVVTPGDNAFDAIHRVASAAGVLVVSDGDGGVVLTRAGATRAATPLIEGVNVLAARVGYRAGERFARYVVLSQVAGTDNASGSATRIRAEATDEGVRRRNRVLVIRPESGLSAVDARRRADWEARLRAARSEVVSISVLGWEQRPGDIWPLNAIAAVRLPSLGVNGDMLITTVEHELGDGGEVTRLSLMRPDAFTPEPQAAVVRTSGGRWKELAGGAR